MDQTNLTIPSPYEAFAATEDATLKNGNRAKQLDLRARIMAVTRRLLAHDGLQGLSVREVAHQCDTSPQNIHKQFGPKEELIIASLLDYNSMMLRHAERQPMHRALALFGDYCDVAAQYPRFFRAMMSIIYSRSAAFNRLHDQPAEWLFPYLEQGDGRSGLGKNVDFGRARQLIGMSSYAAFEWATGMISIGELRHRIEVGTAIFLGGLRGAPD